jgi:glutamate--cysteine ligase
MYFVKREGKYIDCSGGSFNEFLKGKLVQLPGEKPTINDWEDHLSTIFTEVRIKQFIEVRGADAGSWRRTCALPAFWVGLLYDDVALSKALDLCKKWNFEIVEKLSYDVAKDGLKAKVEGIILEEVASELINYSKEGLNRRNITDGSGLNETHFLKVLEETITEKMTPAEQLLLDYSNLWNGDITSLIKEMSY